MSNLILVVWIPTLCLCVVFGFLVLKESRAIRQTIGTLQYRVVVVPESNPVRVILPVSVYKGGLVEFTMADGSVVRVDMDGHSEFVGLVGTKLVATFSEVPL